MTVNDDIRWWSRQLVRLERKVAAVEAGEINVTDHGGRAALYDAYRGVRGLIEHLKARR